MPGIRGKQLADAPNGVSTAKINDAAVTTIKLADGALAATASGRAKMADGFFDAATVAVKFADGSIALGKLVEPVIQADGGQAFTGDQSMGGFRLTGLGSPVADSDAASKGYVDGLIVGLDWKPSVRAATVVAGALATDFENGDVIDGVTLATGNRILIKNQTDARENGIYVVNATGAPTRATDADTGAELDGAAVFVESGTTNADTGWVQTTDAPVIGTSAIAWTQFTGVGVIIGGAGLLRTGNQLDVELATNPGLEFDVAGVDGKLRVLVDPAGAIEREAAGVRVRLDGDSLVRSAAGLKAPVPTTADKYRTPSATSGNYQPTGLTLSALPRGDGMVNILVNGIKYNLKGDRTGDCYFSTDGGLTAVPLSALDAGQQLCWNGTIAGFDLDTTDRVCFDYATA